MREALTNYLTNGERISLSVAIIGCLGLGGFMLRDVIRFLAETGRISLLLRDVAVPFGVVALLMALGFGLEVVWF